MRIVQSVVRTSLYAIIYVVRTNKITSLCAVCSIKCNIFESKSFISRSVVNRVSTINLNIATVFYTSFCSKRSVYTSFLNYQNVFFTIFEKSNRVVRSSCIACCDSVGERCITGCGTINSNTCDILRRRNAHGNHCKHHHNRNGKCEKSLHLLYSSIKYNFPILPRSVSTLPPRQIVR